MPRPKGSKNKVKPTTAQFDFTSLIAEKPSSKESRAEETGRAEGCSGR